MGCCDSKETNNAANKTTTNRFMYRPHLQGLLIAGRPAKLDKARAAQERLRRAHERMGIFVPEREPPEPQVAAAADDSAAALMGSAHERESFGLANLNRLSEMARSVSEDPEPAGSECLNLLHPSQPHREESQVRFKDPFFSSMASDTDLYETVIFADGLPLDCPDDFIPLCEQASTLKDDVTGFSPEQTEATLLEKTSHQSNLIENFECFSSRKDSAPLLD